MAGIGCDNMTVVICALLKGRSEAEWREAVLKRYAETAEIAPLIPEIPDEGVN